MVWLCHGCSVAIPLFRQGENLGVISGPFFVLAGWWVWLCLCVMAQTFVWWNIAKANHMDRRFYMFASVGKKESVWESMHGELQVTKDSLGAGGGAVT